MNRGVPKPWFFIFQLNYWCPCFFKDTSSHDIDLVYDEDDNSASQEKNKNITSELKGDTGNVKGIRVMGLSKTYKSLITRKDTQALKNVFFELKKGELLGVMGHNGAGKSTLINVLCGLVYKDSGNARIFDTSIEKDLRQVRKRMGVVSQFDVLWDELTGIEHM